MIAARQSNKGQMKVNAGQPLLTQPQLEATACRQSPLCLGVLNSLWCFLRIKNLVESVC